MISVKEHIDSFIVDINREIDWKYLKSSRTLKRQINDIVFEINFYSSRFNSADSRIEIKSECQVWCKKYDKSLTVKSGIANIAFLENKDFWWDITAEDSRKAVLHSLIQEINTKVIRFTEEMEKDFRSGLLNLIYHYGFGAYSNSMHFIDETFGREEALMAVNEYAKIFTPLEQKLIRKYIDREADLTNERNLRYIVDENLMEFKNFDGEKI